MSREGCIGGCAGVRAHGLEERSELAAEGGSMDLTVIDLGRRVNDDLGSDGDSRE